MCFNALPDVDRFAALAAIVGFSKFDGGQRPYGEYDFGAVYRLASGRWAQDRPRDDKAIAQTMSWKLDYQDTSFHLRQRSAWDADADQEGAY